MPMTQEKTLGIRFILEEFRTMEEETGVERSLCTGFSTITYKKMRPATTLNIGTFADMGQ